MKEATGEASMTVVTIILIAAILAAATIILGNLMSGVSDKANEVANGNTAMIVTSELE